MMRLVRSLLFWAIIAAMFVSAFWVGMALAHDSWISRGGLKNPAGEWCCGEGDCGSFDEGAVRPAPGGYLIDGFLTIEGTRTRMKFQEFVPQAEVMPSLNGHFVRCHRPDLSRRCFFAPQPNG